MIDSRNSRKNMESLYYSLENDLQVDHPQHKYFKLYEKYTSDVASSQSFHEKVGHRQESSFKARQTEEGLRGLKEKIYFLQRQNSSLRSQVAQQRDMIDRLKYELYYCNTQLQQITKIDSVEYQQAVDELRQEIELMLERAKIREENVELDRYKNKQNIVSQQVQMNQMVEQGIKLNKQHISKKICEINEYKDKNRYFIEGLKDMYGKIMGENARCLKEIWKWLKQIAQTSTRIKKWSKKYRQLSKVSIQIQPQKLIKLLDEALIIVS